MFKIVRSKTLKALKANSRELETIKRPAFPSIPTRFVREVKGRKFYEITEPIMISNKRYEPAQLAFHYLDTRGMSKEQYSNCLEFINQAWKKKDDKGFYAVMSMLETIKEFSTYDSLAQLACVTFLIDGEDANKFDPEIQREKLEIWNSDTDVEAFFLHRAFQAWYNSNNDYTQDTVAFLKELKLVESDLALILEQQSKS